METAAPANLLDAFTLAQNLKATFFSSLGNDSESEDAAAACEAIRAAIDTCEKAAALLKAELVGSTGEDNELPAKRRPKERNQTANDFSGGGSSSSATTSSTNATVHDTVSAPATLSSTKTCIRNGRTERGAPRSSRANLVPLMSTSAAPNR